MRRAVVALTAILVIVFLMEPLAQFRGVEANPHSFGIPIIQVHSPRSIPYIYTKPTVDISFNYHVPKTRHK